MAAEVVIAIAFVVDSSAALASEWSALIQAYIMPMLRRLGEAHPPGMPKFRLAFITYGAQDAPILCKNFFVDVVLAIPAIRDDTVRLGLGQTTCGGGTGLAALEGFVAALELFDILRQSGQMKNAPFLPIFHIFHVAAAMPDSSERPQCNLSPALDSVTWDSLPSELKKRNIHLSTINLRPKLPRFSELHSTSSVSTVAPWFTVRPQHTVLLSGYPTMPQKGTIGMKRPGEPIAADRTPDPKRTKMSPPNINASPPKPKQASPAPPRVQTPATATGRIPTPTPPAPVRIATPTAQPQPPPPSSIPSGPPAPPAPGPTSLPLPRLRQIQDALQAYEATVRALEAAITDARAKGDTALVDRLMPQWTEKNTAFQKLKTNVNAMLVQQRAAYAHAQQQMAAAQQRQAEGQGHQFQQQGQVGHGQMGQSQAGQGQAGQVGHGPAGPAGQGQGQMVQSGPVAPDEGDARMGGGDGNNNGGMMPAQPQPPPPLNVEPPPGHMRQPSGGGGARPTGMLPMSMNPGGMTTSPMITQQMQKMIEQKERARQNNQASKQNSTAVWQGLMTWSGPTPSGEPRSISTFVIASSATPERCHAETWPTSLTVTFAEKPAVSIRDLQIWMKRVTPVLCTFQANPRANNPVNNEMAYKSLVAVLMGKNQYFVVPWTLPNGKHSNNVLLFPVQNAGLVGAFFPLNGIPDLPVELPGNPGSSSIVPNPTAPAPPQNQPAPPQMGGAISPQLLTQINQLMMQNGVQLPPPMLMHLAKVGAVQRNEMMRKLILHGQEQRRQRLADAAAAGGGNANLAQGQGQGQGQQGQGQAGAGMGMLQMGMMGQMGQQQQQQQQHQQQQHQQQQADMAGFNPTQFGLGGGGAGMGGAMGGMSGMGMYSEMMGSAGLPRAVSGGSGGGGAVSYEMMQSFMQRNQEIGGSNGGG